MSNLVKIQKGMKVLQILSKVLFILACVGLALTVIAAILVATDVLNSENQFLHFLSFETEVSKKELIRILVSSAVSLLLGGCLTLCAYRYFTEELKEGTPFTLAGASRILYLGILTVAVSMLSDFVNEITRLDEWSRHGDAGSIVSGLFLVGLSFVFRYGAELEQKDKEE